MYFPPHVQGASNNYQDMDTIMVEALATYLQADLLVLLTDMDGLLGGTHASQCVVLFGKLCCPLPCL